MPTADEYRLLADVEAAIAADADDETVARQALLRARVLRRRASEAEERERPSGLTPTERPRTVNSGMLSDAHKVELSRSRPVRDKAFMKAVRDAGYSLNRLAKAIGIAASSLSQARRKPSDPLFRRIPPEKAKAIEALIRWPSEDWP